MEESPLQDVDRSSPPPPNEESRTKGSPLRDVDKPLPNDDCESTVRNEENFIRAMGLAEYIERTHGELKNRTIVSSRATKKRYVWHNERALTGAQLATYFSKTGHTLGVDLTRTYVRCFAIDVDCCCRASGIRKTEHVNEHVATNIAKRTSVVLRETLNLDRDPILSLWRLECGFHLYSDIAVSLPTHLYLVNIVRASLCSSEGMAVLEVPSIMPLPYSAKLQHKPYKPMLPTQPDTPNLMADYEQKIFHELFRISKTEREDCTVACLRSERQGSLYLSRESHAQRLGCPINYSRILDVEFRQNHEYMSEQMRRYVKFIKDEVTLHDTNPEDEEEDSTDASVLRLEYITDEKVCSSLVRFMQRFNKTFIKEESADPQTFVNLSLNKYGALNLQHYIVMLHKFFADSITLERFKREVLMAIYGERTLRDDPCMERFVRYYDSHTYDSYTDSWEFMMKHLMFLHQHEIDPCDRLNEQIDCYIRHKMGVESALKFAEKNFTLPKSEQSKANHSVITHYIEALVQLRVVMYNSSTSNYYILDNGNHYRVSTKLDGIPTIISDWIGAHKRTMDECYSRIIMNSSRFTYTQTDLLSECKFQFSTSVGVFNSIIGLYSSKSRFLRFLCHRDFAIWEINTPYHMFAEQNERIIERLKVADRMVDILHNRITDIFVHFILAPAMLQLKRVLFVDEFRIAKFNQMIHRHQDLSSANFLIEYFPIDPRFVFVIMHIYNKYDGSNTLSTYAKLSDHVFDYNRVDENSWRQRFTPILETLSYETRDTQLETLRSINGDSVSSPSAEFCLYATLIAVCFIKCKTFAPMLRAFDVTSKSLSEVVRHPHPEYHDFSYETNLDSYRKNAERAIRIIFGAPLDPHTRNLVNAMFILGMSTHFDPETTVELLSTISVLFVPYNLLKKIFLYYGIGGVGKTLICNVIQTLASPKVGRYNNLSQAVERANVTAKTNVTILNELHWVDAETIKSVTGNDAVSTKQFYTQEYEMHNSQSLIYGATNSIVSFRGQTDVDRVTVSRFHAIRLCGRQINMQKRCGSLFIMLTDNQIYRGTIMFKERDLSNAVAWLAYCSYVRRRDSNHFPRINEDNVDSAQYREDIYRSNNKLYDFLSELGIQEAPGFTMSADLLVNLVRQRINNRKTSNMANGIGSSSKQCKFENIQAFKNQFRIQYGVKLENGRFVSDMQQIGLIDHITTNMSTVPSPGTIIRDEDIDERIRMYSSGSDRDNASSYFQRENQHTYDYEARVYRDIEFAHDFSKYMGNEFEEERSAIGQQREAAIVDDNEVVKFIRSNDL